MLLAHIDVVEAKREDWSTDPFKLVEPDGCFYAGGSGDDKFMAAAFVANLIRYRQEGYRPERDIIVALATDEEIGAATALGIRWLIANQRNLIDAEFALNEGAGVGLKNGKPIRNGVQTSEKNYVDYNLEVKNAGGHSSLPRKDNAIYRLAEGLARLGKYDFPIKLNETTRAWFERGAPFEESQTGADMKALAAGHADAAAIARLSAKPAYNAQERTNCGATDSRFLRAIGVPAYGHSGLAGDIDDNRAHGRDERVPVKSFYEGLEYLYQLVKALSGQERRASPG